MSDTGAIPARAVRAVVFASVAITLLLLLRATSDGERPPVVIVLASFGFIAALAWALGSREHSAFTLLSALVATQLTLHVGYLFATTGQLAHPGGAGLFCSPASVSSGSCAPNDRGGALLLVVQLAVALALALVMRGADAECWRVVRRTKLVIPAVVRRLFVAFAGFSAFAVVALPAAVERAICHLAEWVLAGRPRRLLLSHECGRRAPPVGRAIPSLVAAPAFS